MSQKIRIITDSVADIPPNLLEKWNIAVVPCSVNFQGRSHTDDGVDLDRDAFYRDLLTMTEWPTTAAPPVALAEEIMQEALEGYDHLISINVADGMSSTYNNVRLAAQSLPEGRVTVVDSEAFSMGIGWMTLVACEVAAETGDVTAVLDAIDRVKRNHRLYAAIWDLEPLRRSGRVSSFIASVGSLLQIKPIITVQEKGQVEAAQRVRTFKRAKSKLADLLRQEGELERLAVIYTNDEGAATQFIEDHRDILPEQTFVAEVGPTLGTHIGPNSLGFVSLRTSWRA